LLLSSSAFAATSDYNWNLRTSPIAWVVGPNLRLDVRAGEQWTLGVTGVSIDNKIKAVDLSGTTGGVILSFNLEGALTDSWFVDAGMAYGDIRAQGTATNGQVYIAHLYNISEHFVGGYHWFWEHFNLAVGAGVDFNSAGGRNIVDGNGSKVVEIPVRGAMFASEASIGMAF